MEPQKVSGKTFRNEMFSLPRIDEYGPYGRSPMIVALERDREEQRQRAGWAAWSRLMFEDTNPAPRHVAHHPV